GVTQAPPVSIALESPGPRLTGKVLDSKGKPLGGGFLLLSRISDESGDLFVSAVSQDGTFDVLLPRARYQASLSREEYEPFATPFSMETAGTEPIRLRTLAEANAPPPPQAIAWLKRNAVRLESVEAGHGFADMRPLKALVGDARIVALGEGTHGTREFFQFKH